MSRFGLMAILMLTVSGCGYTSSAAICPTHAKGQWIVKSYSLTDVTAVDDKEASQYVGKTVSISDQLVRFANQTCEVTGVDDEHNEDEPGYPLTVDYTCKNNVVVQYFLVGKSCGEILASLDGAKYTLKRR